MEFLHEESGAQEPVYLFKHALTQEVAYESLLAPQRIALHAATGRALETLYADRLEEVYDRLAYHYAKTEEATEAVEYLTRFAETAARKHAHVEAITALQEARVHVERLPAQERDIHRLDVIFRQARSLSSLGRFQTVLDLLLGERERVEQLQNPLLAGHCYFLLSNTYSYLGDNEQASRHARHAIEEAKQCGDESTMGRAYYVLALADFWLGQLLQGLEHGRQAVALLERTEERRWLGSAHWVVGANCALMGEFEPALEAEARAYTIGEATGDPWLQSAAAWTTGWIYAMSGAWEAAIEACQRGLKRAPDPLNAANALGFLGCAYLEKGDPAQAIPLLEQAVQQWSQFRVRQQQGGLTIFLAEAYLLNGHIEKAQELALQGLKLTRDTKFRYGVGLAQRALGRIAQSSGAFSEAEVHLNEALQTFTSIQARFELGRTHLALAELARAQGNEEVAATHLQEAHHLFRVLQVPKYVERAEQLAREFGVPL